MRLAVFFLPLAVALPAWANFQSLQILGWSADEQRFALRLYDEQDSDRGGTSCPGYVNHEVQPFRGSLKLGGYEQGKRRSLDFRVRAAGEDVREGQGP